MRDRLHFGAIAAFVGGSVLGCLGKDHYGLLAVLGGLLLVAFAALTPEETDDA